MRSRLSRWVGENLLNHRRLRQNHHRARVFIGKNALSFKMVEFHSLLFFSVTDNVSNICWDMQWYCLERSTKKIPWHSFLWSGLCCELRALQCRANVGPEFPKWPVIQCMNKLRCSCSLASQLPRGAFTMLFCMFVLARFAHFVLVQRMTQDSLGQMLSCLSVRSPTEPHPGSQPGLLAPLWYK